MKNSQNHFQRLETKYLVSCEQATRLQELFRDHLTEDAYAHSTISNVYFDSPGFQMIQDAQNKRFGREKVRVRTYDSNPTGSSQAFLEIKKKEGELGLKYRMTAPARDIFAVMLGEDTETILDDQRVLGELDQLGRRYGRISPMMTIAYDRFSLKGREDEQVRLTFDQKLIYRYENVSLGRTSGDLPLLPEGMMVMEVKLPGQAPEWLANILREEGLVNQSFSKYGMAYRNYLQQVKEEEDKAC